MEPSKINQPPDFLAITIGSETTIKRLPKTKTVEATPETLTSKLVNNGPPTIIEVIKDPTINNKPVNYPTLLSRQRRLP